MAEVPNRTYIDIAEIELELHKNPELFEVAADILRRDPTIKNINNVDNQIEQIQPDRSEKVAHLVQTLGHFLQSEGHLRYAAIDNEVVARSNTDPSQKQVIYDLVVSNNGNPADYLKPQDLPSDKISAEELEKQKASERAARRARAEIAQRYGREALNPFDPQKREIDKLVSLSKSANLLRMLAVIAMERQNSGSQGKPEAKSAAS